MREQDSPFYLGVNFKRAPSAVLVPEITHGEKLTGDNDDSNSRKSWD